MGTDIFDCIHLCAGRVQGLVALELVARGVRAAALAARERTPGAQRRTAALFLLLRRLALRPPARQRTDCNKQRALQLTLQINNTRSSLNESVSKRFHFFL